LTTKVEINSQKTVGLTIVAFKTTKYFLVIYYFIMNGLRDKIVHNPFIADFSIKILQFAC